MMRGRDMAEITPRCLLTLKKILLGAVRILITLI